MDGRFLTVDVELEWIELIEIRSAINERVKRIWDSNESEFVKYSADGVASSICEKIETSIKCLEEKRKDKYKRW